MRAWYPPPGHTMTATPVSWSFSGRNTSSVGSVTLVTFFLSHFSCTSCAAPGALPGQTFSGAGGLCPNEIELTTSEPATKTLRNVIRSSCVLKQSGRHDGTRLLAIVHPADLCTPWVYKRRVGRGG